MCVTDDTERNNAGALSSELFQKVRRFRENQALPRYGGNPACWATILSRRLCGLHGLIYGICEIRASARSSGSVLCLRAVSKRTRRPPARYTLGSWTFVVPL